ncbi:MAG: DNA-directed RNA polymerase subunit alpha [Synergistaceae bacterium]|nr:DNA-directed RNA polymerase subunit alpha [Synergistaceae bacterium]
MENTNFKVYIDKTTQDYGCLYVEPLERGYGDTLGNALRRLLLSSIKGVAVTAVRIDGVLHEFSTVPGVREDVIEILMNLKHIPIKAKTEKPQLKPEGYKVITLDSDELPKGFFTREENPGVITAKDLPWDNDFEFCGNSVLCTLEPNAHLVMEIYVEPGVGYLSAERERPSHLPVDALLTDAIFSPVKRVNYRIEPARVGQSIDFERLVLEVWTNGAISPEDAVKQASGIARDCFAHIVDKISNVGETSVLPPVEPKPVVAAVEPPRRSIHELELSLRSENCLLRVGIEYIDDLLQRSHDDLLKIRNLGKKSLVEIENKLEELGLQLSTVSMYPDDEVLGDFSSEEDDDENEDITENAEEAAGEAQAKSGEPESKPKKSTKKAKVAEEQAAPVEKAEKAKPKKTASKAKKAAEEDKKPETVETEQAEKAKKPKKTTKKAKAEEPIAKDEDEK